MRFVSRLLLTGAAAASAGAHELCIDTSGPTTMASGALTYCTDPVYAVESCCHDGDGAIEAQVEAYNVADDECAAFIGAVTCAQCDPWGAHIFGIEFDFAARNAPFLCPEYCASLIAACGDVAVGKTPFHEGSTADASIASQSLTEAYGDATAFCERWGPPDAAPQGDCFDGAAFDPEKAADGEDATDVSGGSASLDDVQALCLDKVLDLSDDEPFLDLVAVPGQQDAGVVRMLGVRQSGEIWMVEGDRSGGPLSMIAKVLDIGSVTRKTGEKGLLGVAFHPDAATQDPMQIFVHYSASVADADFDCESFYTGKGCVSGITTSAVANVGVVAEYHLDADVTTSTASLSYDDEVRRVFHVEQLYNNHNGGHILFGPVDRKLYIFLGDGGSGNDPRNVAQDKGSFLGKVLRVDVDARDGNLGYGVPADNPFVGVDGAQSEIWATGMRNPWRCAFDPANPSYLYCADVGQNQREEVDLIVKGGNYGWRKYEGTRDNFPLDDPVEDHVEPIIEYSHDINSNGRHSIAGGFVLRSDAVSGCEQGLYVFGDYYGHYFVSREDSPGSGAYGFKRVPWLCANDTAVACEEPDRVLAFGQDDEHGTYILNLDGVYRIRNGAACGLQCNVTADWVPDLGGDTVSGAGAVVPALAAAVVVGALAVVL